MDLISLLPSLIAIFLAGGNVAILIILKCNDLVHLEQRVTEILGKINEMDKKLDKEAERIAKIEGKCSANHKN
jgi:hypothetical protein